MSLDEHINQAEMLLFVVITAMILFVLGLNYVTTWNLVVAIVFGWVFANWIVARFEIHGNASKPLSFPIFHFTIERITLAYGAYFVAIIIGTFVSEHFLSPLLLGIFRLVVIVAKSGNPEDAYVAVVSLSASVLVLLDFIWSTKRTKRKSHDKRQPD